MLAFVPQPIGHRTSTERRQVLTGHTVAIAAAHHHTTVQHTVTQQPLTYSEHLVGLLAHTHVHAVYVLSGLWLGTRLLDDESERIDSESGLAGHLVAEQADAEAASEWMEEVEMLEAGRDEVSG